MIVAFLGPTLGAAEARRIVPCRVLPPARAGDVWRALALKPRAIALIDGVFEMAPAVWHRELLDALDAGVAVFGASSMGALRAAELWRYGMVGVGAIFEAYRDGRLNDDADVALLHATREHRYRPLTLPLVNARHQVARAQEAGVLTAREARGVVRAAEACFYQERTWRAVLARAGLPAAQRRRFEAFPHQDLKALDARACLQQVAQLMRVRGAPLPPPVSRPPPPSHARRRRAALLHARGNAVAGLRRALLASLGRTLGLVAPPDTRLKTALVRSGVDAGTAARMATDDALEQQVLAHAAAIVNDGPSADEGALLDGLRRRALRGHR